MPPSHTQTRERVICIYAFIILFGCVLAHLFTHHPDACTSTCVSVWCVCVLFMCRVIMSIMIYRFLIGLFGSVGYSRHCKMPKTCLIKFVNTSDALIHWTMTLVRCLGKYSLYETECRISINSRCVAYGRMKQRGLKITRRAPVVHTSLIFLVNYHRTIRPTDRKIATSNLDALLICTNIIIISEKIFPAMR